MFKDDLVGEVFGYLTVVAYAGKSSNGHSQWKCRCVCGGEAIVQDSNLKRGSTVSCGCKRRQQASRLSYKGGISSTRLYSIYGNMKSRTTNPNATAYELYGGRGIKICREWENDFTAFAEWAISNGYQDTLSIDRIDNDKGYSPDNCRWVSMNRQFNNRRNCRKLTLHGETKTMKEWAKVIGIPYHTLCSRIYSGWPVEQALQEAKECTI